jgi:serine/threonine protein kinase
MLDAALVGSPYVGVGSVLAGRYRLERVLGEGGSATVFGGTDQVLARPVAVKVFRGRSDDTAQTRREREIRVASGFVHPNLVAVYDAHLASSADRRDRSPSYLVCEYVDGQPLAQRLDGHSLPSEEVIGIGTGIAQALVVLHSVGVVHRDIKPGNVLLENSTGRAKLTDFGIARDLDTDPVTRTRDVIGTAPYLSPEQAMGERVGCASDIYSLGLVLLECLTGRREFQGDAIPAAVARLVRDPAVPADLPTPWPNLLRRMTSREADRRPTADEIAAILANRHQITATALLLNRGARGSAQVAPVSASAHTRRRGWLFAAAAGALLLTVGGADTIETHNPDKATAPAPLSPDIADDHFFPGPPAETNSRIATPGAADLDLAMSVGASAATASAQSAPIAMTDSPVVTIPAESSPATMPTRAEDDNAAAEPASPSGDAVPEAVAQEPVQAAAPDVAAPATDLAPVASQVTNSPTPGGNPEAGNPATENGGSGNANPTPKLTGKANSNGGNSAIANGNGSASNASGNGNGNAGGNDNGNAGGNGNANNNGNDNSGGKGNR